MKKWFKRWQKRQLKEKIFCALLANPTYYDKYAVTTNILDRDERLARSAHNIATTFNRVVDECDKFEKLKE